MNGSPQTRASSLQMPLRHPVSYWLGAAAPLGRRPRSLKRLAVRLISRIASVPCWRISPRVTPSALSGTTTPSPAPSSAFVGASPRPSICSTTRDRRAMPSISSTSGFSMRSRNCRA